jgi:hypothetical protein
MTSMTCSSCSGASPTMPDPTMPDRRRRRRRHPAAWPLLAGILVVVAALPVGVLAGPAAVVSTGAGNVTDRIVALAPPPETCRPQETRAASNPCFPAPGGGVGLEALLPIVGIVVVGGVVALIAAFVVLRRTSAPLVPADPGEWWTCRNCGKTNVVGSARCYACGAWPR